MWWHPIYTGDPEHAWLRGVFAEAGKSIDAALVSTPETAGYPGDVGVIS